MDFYDDQSSTSSCSSSYDSIAKTNPKTPSPKGHHQPTIISLQKKRAGRKKFKETRHPIYRGVRQRNGSKWVCEVREPNSKNSRIWFGTFPTPEMAARAHDVAALALRGEAAAVLNFPDSAWRLPRAQSSAAVDIRIAAFHAAKAFRPCSNTETPSSSSSSSNVNLLHDATPLSIGLPQVNTEKQVERVLDCSLLAGSLIFNNKENVQEDSSCINDGSEKACDNISTSTFLDEEAIFNMPGLLDSMAEGMLLTPPAMKRGFNWEDVGHDVDLTLWMD